MFEIDDEVTHVVRQWVQKAVSTRYPGDYERIPLTEARQAVRIARRMRKHIRPLLPKAVLRPL